MGRQKQQSLLFYNLQLSIGLEHIPIYIPFPGGSEGKASASMRETWVWSLGQEDPLGKEMATYSSTLAWKIPWTKEPGTLQSMGSQRVGHDWTTLLSLFFGGGYKPPFDVTKRRRKEI